MMKIVTVCALLAGILFIGVQSLSYLEAHNTYRNIEGVPPMTYDTAIATKAAEHAEKCLWEHSSYTFRSNTAGYNYLGENLYIKWGVGSSVTADDVVASWYNEKVDYNPDDLSCTTGKMCGHYTQVLT
ncbi:pathogenesis-related protein 1C-like [Pecten maximus]|uniref:pathogenesis-related protein 1C-like n=1 Tax=Pecten maximus TaxID=6579 RepID=UPI0014589561|nr:pathogenesis-related protein 1C-like [Pecten maximus]